ncbi:MAG TPA: hypothetical protein VN704_05505 [Verrucomicrobiae bacterium]|nr:hypothetical protein [Verrucomicrobiae bacterium]
MDYKYPSIIGIVLIISCSTFILPTFADGYLPPIAKLSHAPTICMIDP